MHEWIGTFSNDAKRAIGVIFTDLLTDEGNMTAHASSEVILSAGPINNPQLLELSGIGNGTLSQSLGIQVLVDNENVGRI